MLPKPYTVFIIGVIDLMLTGLCSSMKTLTLIVLLLLSGHFARVVGADRAVFYLPEILENSGLPKEAIYTIEYAKFPSGKSDENDPLVRAYYEERKNDRMRLGEVWPELFFKVPVNKQLEASSVQSLARFLDANVKGFRVFIEEVDANVMHIYVNIRSEDSPLNKRATNVEFKGPFRGLVRNLFGVAKIQIDDSFDVTSGPNPRDLARWNTGVEVKEERAAIRDILTQAMKSKVKGILWIAQITEDGGIILQ